VAALPSAAALTLLLALLLAERELIRFEYHESELGIVSLATQRHYPVQQEIFWLVFGLGVGSLLTWVLARCTRRADFALGPIMSLEALGAASLLSVLWLRPAAGVSVCALALAATVWMAARRSGSPSERSREEQPWPPGRRPRRTGLWILAAAALGFLLTPGSLAALWDAIAQRPDEHYAAQVFRFLAEDGQHLTWADVLRRGGFQGKDVFCLYGPLYDWPIVGAWAVLGRSIASYLLWVAVAAIAGWTILLVFGGALMRRPALAILLPFLLPSAGLRIGLALLGLLTLMIAMRRSDARWAGLAGGIGGLSLLYSQEYAAVFLLVALIGLLVRTDGRGMMAFGVGFLAIPVPLFGYYAAHGALGPMLHDLVQYPRYLMAGFAKLPFPAITSSLPFGLSAAERPSLALRVGYALPAICLAGALLALPVSDLDPRRPVHSLRAVRSSLARDPMRLAVLLIALFGLGSFRVALGRSALMKTTAVLPPAILLIGFAIDRLAAQWRGQGPIRALAVWRGALLLLFLVHAGLAETASPLAEISNKFERARTRAAGDLRPGHPDVIAAARWIADYTEASEPVLFLPNDAAFYYLTNRRSPIRFVLGHQIVTNAHRAEALADLEASPPRFILWDHGAKRVDGLADDLVLGPEILDWIQTHYHVRATFGRIRILGRRIGADASP
jgi:hypothetical protein